ncbi:family 20 glycosylhydrolase [Georgenia ruanii]|uniref:beta-N-acetylhexosaminidase n=1 Tax=Georgenia ruanii TaxID=348442 RepID=A0A7J9UXE4_9MICO|nr:family 20 glycosylhydrolase [Georgenia ruanii]MPV89142.1 family 20 glycosylhydrolase [Georgenia ruanii]
MALFDQEEPALQDITLVPRPRHVRAAGSGTLDLSPGIALRHPAALAGPAGLLRELLADLGVGAGPVPLLLAVDESASTAGEAYRLEVTADQVTLTAAREAAILAGISTLTQLTALAVTAPAAPGPSSSAPSRPVLSAVTIEDAPRFAWRGLSLDVARHFFTVEEVTEVLGLMFDLRLNVLHLHLTDDQGWRLDLPSRPELAERSSGSAVGGGRGGYFTARDYAQIQQAAARRGITVVPEIDVPGHTNAALHAVPALNRSGVAPEAYTGIEVGFSSLDAALPATATFLRDVFTDVGAMTAGPWVHIGGDEPPEMDRAEYAGLMEAAAGEVVAAGKAVVAWQEAARASLPPGSVVQFWQEDEPTEDVVAAIGAGARLLLSPATRAYLDMKYHPGFDLGLEWAGHTELQDAYEWDPAGVVPGVREEDIVGVEAAVFTETLTTREELLVMLLPRLAAVAEVAWSQQSGRDWSGFATRVGALGRVWGRGGLVWHRSPGVAWDRAAEVDEPAHTGREAESGPPSRTA